MTLAELGWDDFFAEAFAPYRAKGWVPARLIRETTINYSAFVGEEAEAWSRLRGTARLARLGCDAYAYAMVAAGQVDVVLESGLKLWDWAAHKPLIEGAGGAVSGWDRGSCDDGRVLAVGKPGLTAAVQMTLRAK